MQTDIKKLIENTRDLPTPAAIVYELDQVLGDKGSGTALLGEIIERDMSLSAKLLKLANSSYYGLMGQVDSISRAVMVLGVDMVKNVALTSSVFDVFNKKLNAGSNIQELSRHSLVCAIASKALVSEAEGEIGGKAFLCGIMHDLGKIILVLNNMAIMEDAEHVEYGGRSLCELEKELMGFTHADVGALLAEKWNLPQEICDAIKNHHSPEVLEDVGDPLQCGVYLGNQVSRALRLEEGLDEKVAEMVPHAYLEILGISRKDIIELPYRIKHDVEALSCML